LWGGFLWCVWGVVCLGCFGGGVWGGGWGGGGGGLGGVGWLGGGFGCFFWWGLGFLFGCWGGGGLLEGGGGGFLFWFFFCGLVFFLCGVGGFVVGGKMRAEGKTRAKSSASPRDDYSPRTTPDLLSRFKMGSNRKRGGKVWWPFLRRGKPPAALSRKGPVRARNQKGDGGPAILLENAREITGEKEEGAAW